MDEDENTSARPQVRHSRLVTLSYCLGVCLGLLRLGAHL